MERDKKILIVDDEAFIRILLKQTLEDLEDDGVELLVAADGEEGLEMALSQRPCLVFLDVMMPKLNGYEVCRRLKEADSSIYVILLTAKGQAIDRETGFSVGANEYVTKPFDPDYILEKTTEILEINSLT
ncbi:MAG TPA: response regulator [Anaerolineae bacterium]|nr:response regulator [Anaerolineae bacterium]HQH37623.1 response regulator [Anaerolineae bacterium]